MREDTRRRDKARIRGDLLHCCRQPRFQDIYAGKNRWNGDDAALKSQGSFVRGTTAVLPCCRLPMYVPRAVSLGTNKQITGGEFP